MSVFSLSLTRSQRGLFQNLISNAIKFRGPNAPIVKIGAKKHEMGWIFHVTDNGIGIDPANKEKVFEMFKRLHPRSEYEGSGIGLATCRKIVETYGGRIWLESKPGEGTTFYFGFPESQTL